MQRREVIKTVGGIGAAATIGAYTLVGSAAADLTFEVNPVTHTSVDGTISAVLVDADGNVSWEGFDSGVSSIDVKLQTKKPGDSNWETVTTESLSNLSPHQGAKQTDDTGVLFDLEQVDLTETSKFSDGYFSSDTDGNTKNVKADLRVVAVLNTEDGGSRNTKAAQTLNINHTNKAASADANASANPSVSYAGDILDKNGGDTGDDAYLEFDFSKLSSDGVVIMVQHLDNYVSYISGGTSTGAPLNSPIAFDGDEDGTRDFQLGWLIGLSGDPEFGYLDESNNNGWQDTTGISDISASRDGNTITWEIDSAYFGVSSSGDSFRAGGNATAGGDEESVAFCDDDTESEFAPSNMLTVTVPQ